MAGAHQPQVLLQNTGRQAEIVSRVGSARERYGLSLQGLRQNRASWSELVRDVDGAVRKMPLWKLQTVGGQTLEFLYPNTGRGTSIVLYPGVAACFRAFHQLISQLIRGTWVAYLRRQNSSLLGGTAELNAFLFGGERTSLEAYRPLLSELQSGVCFDRQRTLGTSLAVDHFIPWSRYPADLGHNFVLTTPPATAARPTICPPKTISRPGYTATITTLLRSHAISTSVGLCTTLTGRSAWRTGHIHRQQAWAPASGCQAGQSCA